jgi:hypothetical protein
MPSAELAEGLTTPSRASRHLGTFYAEVDPIVIDGGDRRLRHACRRRKLALGHLLKFPQEAHRFSDGHLDAAPGWLEVVHSWSPTVVRRDLNDSRE